VDDELRTLVVELYLYLVTCANITLNALTDTRVIKYDRSLHAVSKAPGSKAFGVMLGCAHDLFEIIPQISRLARLRLLEQEVHHGPCKETTAVFRKLEDDILCWKPPSSRTNQDLVLCGLIFQQGLLVYLYASFYSRDVQNTSSQELILQSLNAAWTLLTRVDCTSPSTTILVWPLTMLGSCAIQPRLRRKISDTLTAMDLYLNMAPPRLALQVLELLWDDGTLFGPLGLEEIMLKNEIVLSVA